jgi:RNA polymerase subunit RPABC4/transcription elongation factor Spt4
MYGCNECGATFTTPESAMCRVTTEHLDLCPVCHSRDTEEIPAVLAELEVTA